MERHFERDLNELKERLLWMGSLAERAVHQAERDGAMGGQREEARAADQGQQAVEPVVVGGLGGQNQSRRGAVADNDGGIPA